MSIGRWPQQAAFLAGLLMVAGTLPTVAQEWTGFRGPHGNGLVESITHPLEWGSDSNMAWSVELPGGGLSSPVTHEGRVFVTTAVGFEPPVGFAQGVRDMRPKLPDGPLQFQVICLDLKDGSQLWSTTIADHQPEHPIHRSNSFATESPTTDGERLYVYFASAGVLAALDFDGNELWRQDPGSYPAGNGFGPGSSLVCGNGKVYLQCDNDEESFVAAYDGKTGQPLWRQSREGRTSWATPMLWKNDRRTELITCGSGFVTSYDPDSGDILWTIDNVSSAFSASPASDSGRIYFGNSGPRSSGPLLAVDNEMTGSSSFDPDQSEGNVTWSRMRAGPGMASPICSSGLLYVPGRGILTCYDASDGTEQFKERIDTGSVVASLWGDQERIFLLDEDGKTTVLEVGPELKVIGENRIEDDTFWSTPAIAGDALLIRGSNRLYCIRK